MTNSIEEISNSDVIFVIGSNTTEQHPVIGMRIIEAVKKNGAKLIVADPRRIPLVEFSSIFAEIKPGTNLAFINSIMNVIISEGLENKKFIEERTEGYEELRESVAEYTPEWAAEITGIAAETIREIARTYASGKNAAILYTMGITQHITGSMNVSALANLTMLAGQIGKPSSGLNPLRGQNNVQGACDMGALTDSLPGYQKPNDEKAIKRFEEAWGSDFARKKGLTVTQIFDAAIEDKIKSIYIIGENPLLSDSDTNHVRKALENLDFLVVQDIFMTETAKMANVVLPASSFMEKDGTFTNTERRVQRVRKVIEPVGGSKPDWEILSGIIKAMGFDLEYNSPSDIMEEIRKVVPIYEGITYERIDSEGIQWPCTDTNHPGTKYLHRENFSRGKGKFVANEYRSSGEVICDDYPFIMTTGRTQHHYHTGTMTRRSWALDREQPRGFIEINPTDAKELGIRDNSRVRVTSRRGSIVVDAKLTDKINPGVVFMPIHFGESPVNKLTNRNLDPIAQIPEFKVCSVRIEVAK